jgi:hypothetical protein
MWGAFLVWCPEVHSTYEVVRNRWTELERPFAHFGYPLREEATMWQPLPAPPASTPRRRGEDR